MAKPLIQVRELTKTYQTGDAAAYALRGVDVDVRPGEVTLLMGPSGSGKTTLISIMGCILKPTSGTVEIDGRDVSKLPESKLPGVRLKNIGFIFQGFNLFPTLTAQENVEVALDLKRVKGGEKRRRAKALMDQVGLSEKLRAYPADLSGGQKQRVAIARALAGDPPIILADEPTAALDIASAKSVMDLLHGLAKGKERGVVIVTHDSRLLEYADRVIHIEDGRIQNGDSH